MWCRDDSSIERPNTDGATGGRTRAHHAESAPIDDGTHRRTGPNTDASADEEPCRTADANDANPDFDGVRAPTCARCHRAGGYQAFQYQPDPMEIVVGTTVVWTNQDEAPHTVTHGTYVKRGGAFDSSTLKQDQSFTFTFDQVGNYMYTCIIHPEMVGTVKVVGS